FSVPGSPSKFAPAGNMADAGRTVPGHAQIPFHIGIVYEHIPFIVKVEVERVPETGTDQLPVFSFRIYFCYPSPRGSTVVGMATGILYLGKEVVVLPHIGQAIGIHFRKIRMVPRNNVKRLA